MFAVSIRQPWAWAIIYAGKDVENRSWPTDHRGPVLIHASKRSMPEGFEQLRAAGFEIPDELDYGGIMGRVDLTGCVRDSRSRWAVTGWWHWLLANPRPLAFEPMRGQQGFWDVSDHDRPPLF